MDFATDFCFPESYLLEKYWKKKKNYIKHYTQMG